LVVLSFSLLCLLLYENRSDELLMCGLSEFFCCLCLWVGHW
jgi:hypothetical protein